MEWKKLWTLCVLSVFVNSIAESQTPWDAIFMAKRELCIAALYDEARWSEYWEGTHLIENQNIGIFHRQSVMSMATYGITDGLNATIMLPHVRTSSDGGQLAGVNGFQDISATLKGRILRKSSSENRLDIIGAASFSTPVSNYLSDYMPYSIGLGAPEFNLRLTGEYSLSDKYYLRVSGAHIWRGTTRIERTFYYQNGSVYSEYMDVPNAISVQGALGLLFLEGRLRTELTYWGTWCTSGDDIRRWLRPQPTNKFEFQQYGLFAQYYFKNLKEVSLIAYANRMFAGRNMGKFTNVSLGATYQFSL